MKKDEGAEREREREREADKENKRKGMKGKKENRPSKGLMKSGNETAR
jgi:hypothetical protein